MECNRDEAGRAREISERKFLAKDFAGAKKFAMTAQNLYPHMDGISQLLATLDVYVSSEKKINGETDWYGVLGVDPLDSEDAIRKRYRKLVLLLHPDKNKVNGADGAFVLISQAWDLLSDKTKRSAYDKKISLNGFQHYNQPHCRGSSTQSAQNGFPNSKEGPNMRVPKGDTEAIPTDFCKRKPSKPPRKRKQAEDPLSSHKKKPPTVPSPHKKKPPTVPSPHKKKPPTVPPPHKKKSPTVPPSYKETVPPTVPPSSHKEKQSTVPPSTVPLSSHKETVPPTVPLSSHKGKPSTVPPSKVPLSSHKEKPSTVPPSHRYKPRTILDYFKQEPVASPY